MTMWWEVILDALIDSLITFAVIFALNFLISFVEDKLARVFVKNQKVSPLIGSAVGLIPQCGLPVVASDMYQKRHITMGTLIAVFIACSDEALPIMLADVNAIKSALPLLLIKFVLGFVVGYIVDLIFTKNVKEVKEALTKRDLEKEEEVHIGCCHHEIESEKDHHSDKKNWAKSHLLHPLIHSLKLFAYIFIINLIFGFIIFFVGEDAISNFLHSNVWLTPLFATFVGMIPNCASSVIITQMYIDGSILFGAALAGLVINAGIGMLVLFKNFKNYKNNLIILGILFIVSIIAGYLTIALQLNFNLF